MKKLDTQTRIVAINEMEMYCEIRGEGEPLLLLHGIAGVGANWDRLLHKTPEGFQLIIPDLRGHGRSTNPDGKFSVRRCAEDILALMDHLGIKQFKAMGLSLGAKTLLHIATREIARVPAMVLVSATPYFPPQARALMEQVTVEDHSDAEWQQMRQWHVQGDDQIRALWKMQNAFKDSYTDMNFTPPYLATIQAKTLIVHGDRDPLYPVHLALELYTAIPQAYLWVVPNGGHVPVFHDPTQFCEGALAFLRGQWNRA